MQNLPQPTIGNISAITITTTDLEGSYKFYQMLGFYEVYRSDFPFPWIQITDGVLLIMLRQDNTPYIALTYYITNFEETIEALEATGIEFISKTNHEDIIKRCLMKSPDGMNVSLVTYVEGFTQPAGPSMLNMPQQDFMRPEKYINKICGLFGELAQPVTDIDTSMIFWKKLGFDILSRRTSPYPWAIISDGLNIVGLHQTTNFTTPIMTFFASDMKAKIELLKMNGLSNYTEKGSPGNIVIQTPEKQYINLFSFDM